MATYKVGSDGKAPPGLSVGDYVVTGGGTYQITAVKPDGTYKSSLVNQGQNTNNYSSGYNSAPKQNNTSTAQQIAQKNSPATQTQQPKINSDVYAGSGSSVSNYGQGNLIYDPKTGRIVRNLNGVSYYVDPSDEKYAAIYAEGVSRGVITPSSQIDTTSDVEIPQYQAPDISEQLQQYQDIINQLQNTNYTPVDVNKEMAKTMSYDEAFALAKNILEPQYTKTYEETAKQSAQNLNRSGLYDSLYGQALASEAQRDVSQDMNSAMGELALNIQNNDWQKVAQTLQMMISENQYGAGYRQNALTSAASASISFIDSIVQQAQLSNNYAIQAATLQLQKEAQEAENLYRKGQLSQMELENKLMELETQGKTLENQLLQKELSGSGRTSGGTGGGTGGGGMTQSEALAKLSSGDYTLAELNEIATLLELTPQEIEGYKKDAKDYDGTKTNDLSGMKGYGTYSLQALNIYKAKGQDALFTYLEGLSIPDSAKDAILIWLGGN